MVNGVLLLYNLKTAIRSTRLKARRMPIQIQTHHLLSLPHSHTKSILNILNHKAMRPIMKGTSILHHLSCLPVSSSGLRCYSRCSAVV
jgi:hypothetical protein